MRLNELQGILRSTRGCIQFAVVYDRERNIDVEDGCSIEYAIETYGNRIVRQIGAYDDKLIITI